MLLLPHYIILFILGAMFGSFVNAWVWRTRKNIKMFSTDRSVCPKCKKMIVWYDNLPILSFIFLGGKCRRCKKSISWQYPLVELWVGVVFVLLGYVHGVMGVEIVRDMSISVILTYIFLYDLLYTEILDSITLPSGLILFVLAFIFGWHSFWSMLIAIIIGAGFFLFLYAVSKGKWIGGGDIRMGLLMGIVLGWPNILLALMIAYVSGAVISMILVGLKKKKFKGETPFGTYLSVATFITLICGDAIVKWYLQLIY